MKERANPQFQKRIDKLIADHHRLRGYWTDNDVDNLITMNHKSYDYEHKIYGMVKYCELVSTRPIPGEAVTRYHI